MLRQKQERRDRVITIRLVTLSPMGNILIDWENMRIFSVEPHPCINYCLDPGTMSSISTFQPTMYQMIGLLLREKRLLRNAGAANPVQPNNSQDLATSLSVSLCPH